MDSTKITCLQLSKIPQRHINIKLLLIFLIFLIYSNREVGNIIDTQPFPIQYACLEDRPGVSTLAARRLKTNQQTTNTNPIYTTRK